MSEKKEKELDLERTKLIRNEILRKELESLKKNYGNILKGARIGKFHRNITRKKEEPDSLTRQTFQDIYDQSERQDLILSASANKIVQSCHNLIDLIHQIKTSYIVNNI